MVAIVSEVSVAGGEYYFETYVNDGVFGWLFLGLTNIRLANRLANLIKIDSIAVALHRLTYQSDPMS